VVPLDAIVQAPFLLAHKINVPALYKPSSDEPLLRITITRFTATGETSVGFSASHAVGMINRWWTHTRS
jgi:hypothetical protein